jgi:mono/diheme cytochrome c family protein
MKLVAAALALAIAIPLSVDIAHSGATDKAGRGIEDGFYSGRSFEGDPGVGDLSVVVPRFPSPWPRPSQTLGPVEAGEGQATEQVRAGYRIAKFVCRVCHIVEPAQISKPILVRPGPSFIDIANRPGITVASLKNLISTADWDLQSRPIRMPNKRLSDRSTEDVAKYIVSLKAPQR